MEDLQIMESRAIELLNKPPAEKKAKPARKR
jgi:hypothetical protein